MVVVLALKEVSVVGRDVSRRCESWSETALGFLPLDLLAVPEDSALQGNI